MPGDDEHLERGWPESFATAPADRAALLQLRCLQGILPRDLHALAWRAGTAGACVDAIAAGKAGTDNDRAYFEAHDHTSVVEALDACDARFVTPHDPEYIESILDLTDPPAAVFVRGRLLYESPPGISVVGARNCSPTGAEIAYELGRGVAAAGFTLVSGGARGIDSAAHRGALAATGRTTAVLGSGIDVLYPRTSHDLLERVLGTGSLVSEYPPGIPAVPHRFPARNRLVAALGRGLVVVEGSVKSGSRISARYALELGRQVFAVPGPVTSELSDTPLEFIREGATPIRGVDDLLSDLGIEAAAPGGLEDLPRSERSVLAVLRSPSLPDAAARDARLSVPDTVAALISLELRGMVRSRGGRYERTLAGSAAARSASG